MPGRRLRLPHKKTNIMVAWTGYLTIGALAALSVPLVDRVGLRDVLYFVVVFYAISGICWGLVSNKPEAPGPWVFYLFAIVSQFTGALIQANTDADGIFGAGLSPADGFLLIGHLCMATALWQFARKQHPEFPRQGFFQGWILATSMLMIGWQFLFLPTILAHGFSLDRPQVFRMVYPTMAYVEIGMLLWIWSSNEVHKSTPFLLLCMAPVNRSSTEPVEAWRCPTTSISSSGCWVTSFRGRSPCTRT